MIDQAGPLALDHIERECQLIIENLAREMQCAKRWQTMRELHQAMMEVRSMANSLIKESEPMPSALGMSVEEAVEKYADQVCTGGFSHG